MTHKLKNIITARSVAALAMLVPISLYSAKTFASSCDSVEDAWQQFQERGEDYFSCNVPVLEEVHVTAAAPRPPGVTPTTPPSTPPPSDPSSGGTAGTPSGPLPSDLFDKLWRDLLKSLEGSNVAVVKLSDLKLTMTQVRGAIRRGINSKSYVQGNSFHVTFPLARVGVGVDGVKVFTTLQIDAWVDQNSISAAVTGSISTPNDFYLDISGWATSVGASVGWYPGG